MRAAALTRASCCCTFAAVCCAFAALASAAARDAAQANCVRQTRPLRFMPSKLADAVRVCGLRSCTRVLYHGADDVLRNVSQTSPGARPQIELLPGRSLAHSSSFVRRISGYRIAFVAPARSALQWRERTACRRRRASCIFLATGGIVASAALRKPVRVPDSSDAGLTWLSRVAQNFVG